jgi:quinol monooxygenase YgiN
MTPIHLLVDLDVADGRQAEFVTMFTREFVARSRVEPGCVLYELWQDRDQPAKMTILEIWESQAHLDAHLAQSWFKEWAPRMEAMMAVPIGIRFFNAVDNSPGSAAAR